MFETFYVSGRAERGSRRLSELEEQQLSLLAAHAYQSCVTLNQPSGSVQSLSPRTPSFRSSLSPASLCAPSRQSALEVLASWLVMLS